MLTWRVLFKAECTLRVRLMQTYHMESKRWDDIGYNWLVGGDGAVYEGRGWDKLGSHTLGKDFIVDETAGVIENFCRLQHW